MRKSCEKTVNRKESLPTENREPLVDGRRGRERKMKEKGMRKIERRKLKD